jgi:hypothetical protein
MIQAKCIQKFRDSTGKIYGYRLQDLNGKTQDVQPDNLKAAIRNKQIHIVNLTLTSDNRLVDTTEKQLQAKVLGKAPVEPGKERSTDRYSDVAKALVLLDKELLCMGDSYREVVENRAFDAGDDLQLWDLDEYYEKPEYKDCKDDDEILDRILYKTYIKLLNNKPIQVDTIIKMWNEYDSYDTFESNVKYENVSKITQSKIYQALFIVYKHAKEQKYTSVAVRPLGEFLSRIRRTGIASINMGYGVGNCYYRYLDSKLFGTISNDVFTVGHTITTLDVKEHKEYKGYSYVLHKDISRCGSPDIALAAMFKNTNDGNVQIDVKLARQGYLSESQHCVGLVGYIKNFDSIIVNPLISVEACAKKLANIFNMLAPKLYNIADDHQSLYFMKKHGAPLEQIGDAIGSHTDKELLDLAISRWTKIRGDKTPAKIDKILSKTDSSLKVLYANNVSDNGNNYRLLVECTDGTFTINVINGNNIDDIIITESGTLNGSIKESSAEISEVLTKAIISANVRQI